MFSVQNDPNVDECIGAPNKERNREKRKTPTNSVRTPRAVDLAQKPLEAEMDTGAIWTPNVSWLILTHDNFFKAKQFTCFYWYMVKKTHKVSITTV